MLAALLYRGKLWEASAGYPLVQTEVLGLSYHFDCRISVARTTIIIQIRIVRAPTIAREDCWADNSARRRRFSISPFNGKNCKEIQPQNGWRS